MRLKEIVAFKGPSSVEELINHTVREVFLDLRTEFALNSIKININSHADPVSLEIEIEHNFINNFKYGVRCQEKSLSEFMMKDKNLPDIKYKKTYYPRSFFGDTREGYDVQYFTKTELISDVLKHYERFLAIVSEEANEMCISSNANKDKS